MNETAFSKSIIRSFKQYNVMVQRFEDKYALGIPDLLIVYKGRSVWLELKVCKVSTRWLTEKCRDKTISIKFQPQQIPWLTTMNKAGGEAYVLTQWGDKCYMLPPRLTYSVKDFLAKGQSTRDMVKNILMGDLDEL